MMSAASSNSRPRSSHTPNAARLPFVVPRENTCRNADPDQPDERLERAVADNHDGHRVNHERHESGDAEEHNLHNLMALRFGTW